MSQTCHNRMSDRDLQVLGVFAPEGDVRVHHCVTVFGSHPRPCTLDGISAVMINRDGASCNMAVQLAAFCPKHSGCSCCAVLLLASCVPCCLFAPFQLHWGILGEMPSINLTSARLACHAGSPHTHSGDVDEGEPGLALTWVRLAILLGCSSGTGLRRAWGLLPEAQGTAQGTAWTCGLFRDDVLLNQVFWGVKGNPR